MRGPWFLSPFWNFFKRDNRFPRAMSSALGANAESELERKKDVRGRHSAHISIVASHPSHFLFLSFLFRVGYLIHSRDMYARVCTALFNGERASE